ncbi:hypothetical protein G3545_08390 [Starkeya sp. ORNL1]|uniref:hypothetical protein n=1 Tax=Starkeya sp. ORNL1 TaxID=2709380 RepID=UPI0014637DB8|nr:hypothetical protein [Starkeya sp. ORNL1]QJP13671.1 hypothetical protein G3545_08390 [Starkeya sp. ORNL1]
MIPTIRKDGSGDPRITSAKGEAAGSYGCMRSLIVTDESSLLSASARLSLIAGMIPEHSKE